MSTVELLSKLREAAKTARLGQPQTNEGQMQTNEGQMQTSPGQPQTNEGQTESAHDSNSFIHRLEVALLEEGVNILPLDAEVNGQFLVVDYLITCEDGELEVKSAGRSMTAALVSLLKTLGGGVAEGYPRRTGGSQAERGFPGEQGVPRRKGGSQENRDTKRECSSILAAFCNAHGLDIDDTKDAYVADGGNADPEMLKAWLQVHYSLGRAQ